MLRIFPSRNKIKQISLYTSQALDRWTESHPYLLYAICVVPFTIIGMILRPYLPKGGHGFIAALTFAMGLYSVFYAAHFARIAIGFDVGATHPAVGRRLSACGAFVSLLIGAAMIWFAYRQ